MTITNAIASVAVSDAQTSAQWYEHLFGRAADSTPAEKCAEWKFERGGGLQVYELKGRAGAGSVTLSIGNLERQMDDLRKLGIDPGSPISDGRTKVVMIKDPDGNSIAFVESICGDGHSPTRAAVAKTDIS
jgi:hypothetical protein